MEKLTNNEMMNISGGTMDMSCAAWFGVIDWLNYHGHHAQAASVIDNNYYGCIS